MVIDYRPSGALPPDRMVEACSKEFEQYIYTYYHMNWGWVDYDKAFYGDPDIKKVQGDTEYYFTDREDMFINIK